VCGQEGPGRGAKGTKIETGGWKIVTEIRVTLSIESWGLRCNPLCPHGSRTSFLHTTKRQVNLESFRSSYTLLRVSCRNPRIANRNKAKGQRAKAKGRGIGGQGLGPPRPQKGRAVTEQDEGGESARRNALRWPSCGTRIRRTGVWKNANPQASHA